MAIDLAPWSALLGGAIGIAGTYFGGRRLRLEEEVRRAGAELLAACDAMWSADTVFLIAVQSDAYAQQNESLSPDERAACAAALDKAREDYNAANRRARSVRDQILLLSKRLEGPAERVYETAKSRTGREGRSPLPSPEEEAARADVRRAFVKAARSRLL